MYRGVELCSSHLLLENILVPRKLMNPLVWMAGGQKLAMHFETNAKKHCWGSSILFLEKISAWNTVSNSNFKHISFLNFRHPDFGQHNLPRLVCCEFQKWKQKLTWLATDLLVPTSWEILYSVFITAASTATLVAITFTCVVWKRKH
jgi:hypothetical protein